MRAGSLGTVRPYRRLMLANAFTKALTDRLWLTLIVGLGVGAMCVAMGPLFKALADTIAEMMEGLPDTFMAIAGGADMTTAAGYYTGEIYSIMAPFAAIVLAVLSVGKAFGGEVEDRSMGLLLANPIHRGRLAVHKLAAMVVQVAVAAALFALGTAIGVTIADLDVSMADIVAINVMLALLAILYGTLAMVIAVITGRRLVAVLSVAMLALVSYLWSGFVPLVDAVAGLAGLSPWYHYIGGDPLNDGLDWGSALLLGGLALGLAAVGVTAFRRRDIPG